MEITRAFDDKDTSEDEWSTNSKSVESLRREFSEESQETTRHQQNIILMPQDKIRTERPIIPASWMEKLSYYRAFTSSSSKIEILCLQQNDINMFMWFYVSNTLSKSLSMTYVYIFLSAYAPDHHFFVPKMVPIFYGLKWINVVCARFLLQTIASDTSVHFYYAVVGILFKAPWNRCEHRTLYYFTRDDTAIEYTCMELREFAEQFVNQTITMIEATLYKTPTDEYFSVAQIEHYDFIGYVDEWGTFQCLMFAIEILVWVIAAVLYNQLYRGWIWKILHYAQLALCVFLLLIFFHLLICYEDKTVQHIDSGETGMRRELLMLGDFDMLAEAMTSPPVAHVLSARTTADIRPSFHSAVTVISNGVFYVFKALTTTMMKQYCDRWVNAPIIHWSYGSASNFYFWPIYFATLRYGDVIAVAFFALNAVVEYCMFIITFQCLIEVVKYEWSWMKPWCIAATIVVLSIAEVIYLTLSPTAEDTFSSNSFIIFMSLSSLAEILVIFWLYPLKRFLDDITFHFGASPTRLRRWAFCLLPWFYLFKIWLMMMLIYEHFNHGEYFSTKLHLSRHVPTCVIMLLVVGAVYAFYKYVIKGRKGFSQLFKPVPEWGPKDFRLRQLRKQFDSRDYIASQAPRDLSRYLIEKAGMASYKLDMPYEAKRKWASRGNLKDGKEKERSMNIMQKTKII